MPSKEVKGKARLHIAAFTSVAYGLRSASAASASAAPLAASSAIQQNEAKLETNADLKDFPLRRQQRFQLAKMTLNKVLLDSLAFTGLDATKQALDTEEIEALLREDMYVSQPLPSTPYFINGDGFPSTFVELPCSSR